MTVLDAQRGAALKQAGMQLALDIEGDWLQRALAEFEAWLTVQKAMGHSTVTVEQFRAVAMNRPARHFAWGPFPVAACKAGLIEPEWIAPGHQMRVKAASVRTHGHEVKVWRAL